MISSPHLRRPSNEQFILRIEDGDRRNYGSLPSAAASSEVLRTDILPGNGFPSCHSSGSKNIPSFLQENHNTAEASRTESVNANNEEEGEPLLPAAGRRQKPRPKSFDFGVSLDPPSKLIEEFLQRQKASGDLSLDMDMDMAELSLPNVSTKDLLKLSSLSEVSEASSPAGMAELNHLVGPGSGKSTLHSLSREWQQKRVSFENSRVSSESGSVATPLPVCLPPLPPPPSPPPPGDGSPNAPLFELSSRSSSSSSYSNEEEIATPVRSFRSGSLGGAQVRSRLADIPLMHPLQVSTQQEINHRAKSSQLRSGPMRSGMINRTGFLGKVEEEEKEEDPLEGDFKDGFQNKSGCGFWYVLQWVAFFIVLATLAATLSVPQLKRRLLLGLLLWKWVLVVFLLFSGRFVSGWLVRIVVLLLERSFVLRKRVLYFVYALRRGVQNLLWFVFAVLAWRFVFDPKIKCGAGEKLAVLCWVTKVLNCFLIAAVVWLIKIFCVKVVASSFHVSTYFDRIQESLFSQYVLETLSGPPIVDETNIYEDENDEEFKFMKEVDDLKKAGVKLPECMASLPKQVAMQRKPPIPKTYSKSSVIPGRSERATAMGSKSGLIAGGKSGFVVGVKSGLLKSDRGGNNNQEEEEEARKKKSGEEQGIAIDHLQRLNQRNVSAWHMKRLVKFVRSRGISTMVHAIDESAAQGQENEEGDGEIQSEWQARLVARKIFLNVAKPGYKFIMADDLARFMGQKEVLKAIPLFEGAVESGGKITKNALKNFVVYVFRERRALALSLNDTKTAVKKLHKVIDVVASVIIIVIWLVVLGLATRNLFVLVSSQLVLVVFIFGNSAKTLFEAIVFLFVMHPFDVGDRCLVEGNQVIVEEMNILSTLFLKSDGEKVWYPNSVLATKSITNYYRTPDTGDTFNFSVHVSTPIEKINALKEKIERYLASKPNHWTTEMHLVVQEIEDMNNMKIQLMVNHTIDYHDVLERQIRRSNLILEVRHIFEEVGMEYRLLPQDVRLVPYPTM